MSTTTANTNPIFQRLPSVQAAVITDADTNVPVTLYTSVSTEGGLIDSISAVSTDSAAAIIQLTITDNAVGTDYAIGEVTVPANSGTDGTTPAFNLLSALLVLQESGGRTIPPSGILKVNAKATITAATQITFVANGGDY